MFLYYGLFPVDYTPDRLLPRSGYSTSGFDLGKVTAPGLRCAFFTRGFPYFVNLRVSLAFVHVPIARVAVRGCLARVDYLSSQALPLVSLGT